MGRRLERSRRGVDSSKPRSATGAHEIGQQRGADSVDGCQVYTAIHDQPCSSHNDGRPPSARLVDAKLRYVRASVGWAVMRGVAAQVVAALAEMSHGVAARTTLHALCSSASRSECAVRLHGCC